ncbi:MAG: hydrogenase expression protein HupH [Fastidiosipila sp.]|nr:hydrogenase expression protein HupH [Fastidiosipila sp.]
MKIKTIMANCSQEFFDSHSEIRRNMATKDIELLVANIEKGPLSLESPVDEVFAGPYILKEVASAVNEGCDAVVIDCAADPVMRAARHVSSIPVVSAGEASHHAAMMLCDKFSIVTTMAVSVPMFKENIAKYGYSNRVASVRAIELPVLALEDIEKTFQALCKTSEIAIEEDGAEVIVLGCTGMMETRDRLQEYLQIPVVEPLSIGIQYAAAMVNTNLRHSPICYMKASDSTVALIGDL